MNSAEVSETAMRRCGSFMPGPNDKIRIIPATSQCSGRKLSSPLGCSLLAGTDRRMPSSPSLSGQEMSRLKGQAP